MRMIRLKNHAKRGTHRTLRIILREAKNGPSRKMLQRVNLLLGRLIAEINSIASVHTEVVNRSKIHNSKCRG